MINWNAFTEPTLWWILLRMAWTLFGLVMDVAIFIALGLAFWHGWSIEIGSSRGGFHAHYKQFPLKRFFK